MSKTLNFIESSESNTPLQVSDAEISGESFEGVQAKKTKDEQEFILYGYRKFELALYCFAAMSNQMTWISLQPVAGAIENGYGYGATALSALGITYMVVFLIVNYPANIIINKGGLRMAVLVGMGFTFLGMLVKCLVNKSFIWVIVG